MVGRDNGADTFVVNAGAAQGPQDFDLHLWGLDESDTLRFEGLGALTSFVAQGSIQHENGHYIEHSAVLTFVGVNDSKSETTDDSWTVNATFHQDATRDFDFMKLVVDPDGKVDGADDSNSGTYPFNLDAKNLILFDDDGPIDGSNPTDPDLYEFDLNRPDAMQEAGLSFDGETIDIYLLDGGATSENEVKLIGFMGETVDKDPGIGTDFVYEELKDAIYDEHSTNTLTSGSISVVDTAADTVAVATASATFTTPSTKVDITTDTAAAGGTATATLNFVDEELVFVSFSDTASSFSELDLSTVS